ncbi:hypothetical protein ACHAWF_001995 [Thalassiosira exigua]
MYEHHGLLSFDGAAGLPKRRHLSSLSFDSTKLTKKRQLGPNQSLAAAFAFAIIFALFFVSSNVNQVTEIQDQPEKKGAEKVKVKQQQITNYIKGTAIILTIHIVHHAGTSVCAQMKKVGPSPDFACIGSGRGGRNDPIWPSEEEIEASGFGKHGIETHLDYNETELWVRFWRLYFHFVSMEYRNFGNLHAFNWEYENLVSMIVMRDPLERFLSGGKCGGFQHKIPKDPTNETQDLYWEYANSDCVDNFALRVLTNKSHCENGENTSITCLESAKELLSRFTFLLDKSCLDDSMVALGNALNLNITNYGFESRLKGRHGPIRTRFGNDTLYDHVRRRFRRDIELYEWSKERSIVVCSL